ncbi:eukaryotic peptide chain release factor GTP-binding subunit ERF3A-like [Ylistrum balloti]|uniref:eukaryotic peptide chain release factor GTP-binding subunit ERF3A-like n=1 Tax=Ylistrum balloti TaxID=509963 RepID=UPI0029058176|nr:eukaryotic peptide chain release factor GTP-binding subunit ERF3A-like [Ylistrum balloti]
MATENGDNGAPDSWDQEIDSQNETDPGKELAQPLSFLNVNAAPFVPGQNVFATEFVPVASKTDDATPNEGTPTDESGNAVGDENMETEQEPAGDDWAAEDEEDSEEVVVKPIADTKKGNSGPQEVEVKKEHINVVFIGHVDAGKSTIGGHIMYLTGMVDKRTLEKYEREAKEKNRETWYLSWALDTNSEEREKGKTVEVGRAYFETPSKHFTILDAPGHKSFVPNMIGGASQADLAVLVISARRGEFETGFERGGQTREHAMLVKTAGVKHLVIVINKMDDPTVQWSEERYNECREKLIPYLKKCGFNPKTDLYFMPVSGLTGAFLKFVPDESVCPWYRGPSLIDYLDDLNSLNRSTEMPVRMPIVDKYRDMGTLLLGKLEAGVINKNMSLMVMPNRAIVKVNQLYSDEIETELANPGENLKVKVQGVEEEDISPGFVLCPMESPCNTGKVFDAQIVILEHKSIICAGYSAVLHIHTCAEEVTLRALLCIIDKKTGDKTQVKPRFVKQDQVAIARIEVNGGMICLETFKDFPQMGRFTLRDEGKTIGIGKVLKIIN